MRPPPTPSRARACASPRCFRPDRAGGCRVHRRRDARVPGMSYHLQLPRRAHGRRSSASTAPTALASASPPTPAPDDVPPDAATPDGAQDVAPPDAKTFDVGEVDVGLDAPPARGARRRAGRRGARPSPSTRAGWTAAARGRVRLRRRAAPGAPARARCGQEHAALPRLAAARRDRRGAVRGLRGGRDGRCGGPRAGASPPARRSFRVARPVPALVAGPGWSRGNGSSRSSCDRAGAGAAVSWAVSAAWVTGGRYSSPRGPRRSLQSSTAPRCGSSRARRWAPGTAAGARCTGQPHGLLLLRRGARGGPADPGAQQIRAVGGLSTSSVRARRPRPPRRRRADGLRPGAGRRLRGPRAAYAAATARRGASRSWPPARAPRARGSAAAARLPRPLPAAGRVA